MDDCISRQAMLDGIDKLIKIHFDRTVVLYKARQVAENLPSVQPEQPERKTGRWIPCPQNASWLYAYKCSECGGYLQISDVDGKGYKANYCSYCGAKMEREERR